MSPEPEPNDSVAPSLVAIADALAANQIGMWTWDAKRGALRWSPEVEAIFGLAPGAFEGTFEAYFGRVLPEDQTKVRHAIDEAFARARATPNDHLARSYFTEHRVVRPDGTPVWIEGRGHVQVDDAGQPTGIAGLAIDITARKQAEQALREQAEEYRLFTEMASDYVYSAEVLPDMSLRTTIVAGSFERTTGYTLADMERAGGWLNLIHPDDKASMLAIAERLLVGGESLVNEYRIRDPGGETRWLRDQVRPVKNEQGHVRRIVGGVTDITQRKRLEAELAQARKMEAIGRLAGAVAHDFNNLLTVVLNSVEIYVRAHPEAVDDEDLNAIMESAKRGGDLTRSLLSIGRRQVGRPTTVAATELLRGAQAMLSRALGENIRLEIETQPDLGVSIDGSQAHIMLLNMALNARDAMPQGGVFRITARSAPPEIVPHELAHGEYAVLSLSDHGSGIRPELVPYLFEPFFTTKADKGNGLGLATCLGIARNAGGTITCRSVYGSGTTFDVFLPTSALSAAPADRTVISERGGRESVLVVEDQPQLRALVTRVLRARGYTVLAVGSAEEGLTVLASHAVAMALLDIGLPGMSGTELALRIADEWPRTRIALMSGNPGDSETQSLVRSGVPFLHKPFDAKQLSELVRSVLDVSLTGP